MTSKPGRLRRLLDRRKKPKVLLVDDDEDMRAAVAAFLKDADLVTMGSAQGMLRALKREKPDLLFLDVMMPGLDGTTALSMLNEHGLLGKTRVVLFSSLAEEDLARWSRKLGAAGFVHKGQSLPELASQVRSWVFTGKYS